MARSEQDIEKLLAEVASLRAELDTEKTARTAAEQMAHTLAQFSSNGSEQPTGKTMKVKVCANPEERDAKKQVWTEIEFPTFAYRIDLPVGCGISINTNGRAYFHGETYEFTERGLADMKSRVFQCWNHEKMIHGDNVNSYRRQREDLV